LVTTANRMSGGMISGMVIINADISQIGVPVGIGGTSQTPVVSSVQCCLP
jgi:hypothetical protein